MHGAPHPIRYMPAVCTPYCAVCTPAFKIKAWCACVPFRRTLDDTPLVLKLLQHTFVAAPFPSPFSTLPATPTRLPPAPLPDARPTCPQPDVAVAINARFMHNLGHCLRHRYEEDLLVPGPALLPCGRQRQREVPRNQTGGSHSACCKRARHHCRGAHGELVQGVAGLPLAGVWGRQGEMYGALTGFDQGTSVEGRYHAMPFQ